MNQPRNEGISHDVKLEEPWLPADIASSAASSMRPAIAARRLKQLWLPPSPTPPPADDLIGLLEALDKSVE